jgi:hypothetical protein
MKIEKLFEIIGIDLIPYAIGLSKFKSNLPFEPIGLQDVRVQLQDLDAQKLEDALTYSKELLDSESARGEKTESKAYSLIGVTGISAAFVTGISSLLPNNYQLNLPFLLVLLLISYLLIVVSLTMTVLLASRVVMVRSYTYPDIADVFGMSSQSLLEAKLDRLATYLYCYAKNCQTHNVKVSYLMGAQLWFRNSVIVFLLLAFILIPNFINSTTGHTQISVTETSIITVTAQQISSASAIPPTLISPTYTVTVQSTPATLPSMTLANPTSDILSVTVTPSP